MAALLNFLPHVIGETSKITFADGAGGTDYYVANSLNDNIIYSYVTLGVTIAAAVFIGVYNVIGEYIGKASSALFVLVPSIVWLLTTSKTTTLLILWK